MDKKFLYGLIFTLFFTPAVTLAESVFINSSLCEPAASPCEPAAAPCEPVTAPCEPAADVSCESYSHNSLLPLFKSGKSSYGKGSLLEQIKFDGWIQTGFYANSRGTTTTRSPSVNSKGQDVSSPDFSSGNSALLTTLRSADWQVNQIWLNTRKDADTSKGWDWGFGAEILFGTDGWISQSWNDAAFDYGWQNGDYFTSIPRLYFQLAYADWSIKVGKYETLVGYEPFRAQGCFFYSHTHTFAMESYSHSGALLEYTPNNKFYAALGYTTGTDGSFENKYDDHGLLGYVSYQFTPNTSLSYAFHVARYGNEQFYPSGNLRWWGNNNTFFHSLTFRHNLSAKWSYALLWEYGDAKNRTVGNHRIMYGITNYLIYQINDQWGLGFRASWAKDDKENAENIYGGYGWVGYYQGEVYSYTLGLKWNPYENISIRPEIRYDYCADPVFN
ncbi:MAG: porin, partial [Planctomycetaceae bacterium]|nr:porin [Planctomycetaceae bacterium]